MYILLPVLDLLMWKQITLKPCDFSPSSSPAGGPIDGLQYATLTAISDVLTLEKCTRVGTAHDYQPIHQILRPMTHIGIHL